MNICTTKLGLAMLKAGVNHTDELAAFAHLPPRAIPRLMRGKTRLSVLKKLAVALAVPPEALLPESHPRAKAVPIM